MLKINYQLKILKFLIDNLKNVHITQKFKTIKIFKKSINVYIEYYRYIIDIIIDILT